MGEQANLSRAEANEKIQHIAKGEVGMLHTIALDGRDVARPMSTSAVDDDGTLWFMTRDDSEKCRHLMLRSDVRLTYSVSSRSEYLTLEGEAALVRDAAKISDLWSPLAKTWFPQGKEDPAIVLIRVTPRAGHYWDTKHNKMVQLVGMVVGALTGKETDDSIEGSIRR